MNQSNYKTKLRKTRVTKKKTEEEPPPSKAKGKGHKTIRSQVQHKVTVKEEEDNTIMISDDESLEKKPSLCRDVQDLICGDEQLVIRSKAWIDFMKKLTTTEEKNVDEMGLNSTISDDNSDESKSKDGTFVSEHDSSTSSKSLNDILTKYSSEIELRQKKWDKTGLDFLMHPFKSTNYENKVNEWITKNFRSNPELTNEQEELLGASGGARNCTIENEVTNEMHLKNRTPTGAESELCMRNIKKSKVSSNNNCDSLHSVDTAQYILSNKLKKRNSSAPTKTTIKNYRICINNFVGGDAHLKNPASNSTNVVKEDAATAQNGAIRRPALLAIPTDFANRNNSPAKKLTDKTKNSRIKQRKRRVTTLIDTNSDTSMDEVARKPHVPEKYKKKKSHRRNFNTTQEKKLILQFEEADLTLVPKSPAKPQILATIVEEPHSITQNTSTPEIIIPTDEAPTSAKSPRLPSDTDTSSASDDFLKTNSEMRDNVPRNVSQNSFTSVRSQATSVGESQNLQIIYHPDCNKHNIPVSEEGMGSICITKLKEILGESCIRQMLGSTKTFEMSFDAKKEVILFTKIAPKPTSSTFLESSSSDDDTLSTNSFINRKRCGQMRRMNLVHFNTIKKCYDLVF